MKRAYVHGGGWARRRSEKKDVEKNNASAFLPSSCLCPSFSTLLFPRPRASKSLVYYQRYTSFLQKRKKKASPLSERERDARERNRGARRITIEKNKRKTAKKVVEISRRRHAPTLVDIEVKKKSSTEPNTSYKLGGSPRSALSFVAHLTRNEDLPDQIYWEKSSGAVRPLESPRVPANCVRRKGRYGQREEGWEGWEGKETKREALNSRERAFQ